MVFEISEQESIDNFAIFREVRDYYGNLGFKIALDDTGAGYASLEAVMELAPDFIKVDRAFVSRIDEDPARQELLAALQSVADRLGAQIIGEGLDTLQELETLGRLGISFGPGLALRKASPAENRHLGAYPESVAGPERAADHVFFVGLVGRERLAKPRKGSLQRIQGGIEQPLQRRRDGDVFAAKPAGRVVAARIEFRERREDDGFLELEVGRQGREQPRDPLAGGPGVAAPKGLVELLVEIEQVLVLPLHRSERSVDARSRSAGLVMHGALKGIPLPAPILP